MSEETPAPMSPPAEESKRWLDQPDSGKKLFWALAAACLGLLAWDLGYHQHGHLDFEEWFGFHAWFGFLAYCFIVGSAVMMRKVLKRPEDYYDAE